MASHEKLQEEERERRNGYDLEESEADANDSTVGPNTGLIFEGAWNEQFTKHYDALSPNAPRRGSSYNLECGYTGEDLHNEKRSWTAQRRRRNETVFNDEVYASTVDRLTRESAADEEGC